MRGKNQACAFLNGEAKRRNRFTDARVVRHNTVLERNVKIHANKNALAAEFEIVDGQFVHFVLTLVLCLQKKEGRTVLNSGVRSGI